MNGPTSPTSPSAETKGESAVLVIAMTTRQTLRIEEDDVLRDCVKCGWQLVVGPLAIRRAEEEFPHCRIDFSCFYCVAELDYDNLDEYARETFREIARLVGPKPETELRARR